MSEGIIEFATSQLEEQLGQDGKEGKTYAAKLSQSYRGQVVGTIVNTRKGALVAVKTFRKTKSTARIMKEAMFQQRAADVGVSPRVLGVNIGENYIVMDKLISLPVKQYKSADLPDALQYMICALMGRLDDASVLHSDMNPLNVMLDKKGRPWMIDFGFAKFVDKKVLKKYGKHPNIAVTLWGLVRGFQRNGVGCDIMSACVKATSPLEYIGEGEKLLNTY